LELRRAEPDPVTDVSFTTDWSGISLITLLPRRKCMHSAR
jgi:hypothetical protein